MEYAVQDLVTGIDTMTYNQNSGTGTLEWITDEGGYARHTWNSAGTRGLRWAVPAGHSQLYVRFDLRRSSSAWNSKQCKIFGIDPPTLYSNFTFGPQMDTYLGGTSAHGVAYSDWVEGGDNLTGVRYNGDETGTFQRSPHPTQEVVTSNVTQAINDWDTWEMFVRYNSNGTNNGRCAVRKNGTLIMRLVDMWNCAPDAQEFSAVGLSEYDQGAGAAPYPRYEDYRDFRASYDTPSWG